VKIEPGEAFTVQGVLLDKDGAHLAGCSVYAARIIGGALILNTDANGQIVNPSCQSDDQGQFKLLIPADFLADQFDPGVRSLEGGATGITLAFSPDMMLLPAAAGGVRVLQRSPSGLVDVGRISVDKLVPAGATGLHRVK
jgi:hypothetical protein